MANNNFMKTTLSLTSPICMDINDNVVRPFDSFNKKNAPFIGDQLSPFYVEEEKAVDGEVTPVYDEQGNRWSLINNKLCKNGVAIPGSIPFEKTFTKTKIDGECIMSRRLNGVLYEVFKKLIYKDGFTYIQIKLTNGTVTKTVDTKLGGSDLIVGADIVKLKNKTDVLALIYSNVQFAKSNFVDVTVSLYNLGTLDSFVTRTLNNLTSPYNFKFEFNKISFVNISNVIVNGEIEGIGLSFCTKEQPYSMVLRYQGTFEGSDFFSKDSLFEATYEDKDPRAYILFVNGKARYCPKIYRGTIPRAGVVYNELTFSRVYYDVSGSSKYAQLTINNTPSPEVPVTVDGFYSHCVLYPGYYNILRHWGCTTKSEPSKKGNLTLRITNGGYYEGDGVYKHCGWNDVTSLANAPSIYYVTERGQNNGYYFGVNINNDFPNSIVSKNNNLIISWNDLKDTMPILTFRDDSEVSFYYTDNNENTYLVTKTVEPYIMGIFDDRYILINSDNLKNVYDIKKGDFHKWSSGYNGALKIGDTGYYYAQENELNTDTTSKVFGAAYNPLFEISKIPFTSPAFNFSNLIDVWIGNPDPSVDVDIFECSSDKSLVPIYSKSMRTSLLGTKNIYINQDYIGLYYPYTDNIIYSPSLFSKFFTTLNNHDFLFNGTDFYPLIYSNNTRIFAYRAFSFIENINTAFVLQSNNYVVTNNKILAVQYQGSQLTNITPICSITGMKFIGNTSQVAFFYSYLSKKIYIFTGDTVLREQRGANVIDEVYSTFFIPADNTIIMSCREHDGVETAYFFGNDSFLRIEVPKIKDCYYSDNKVILIDDNNNARKLSYFKNPNGKKIPIELQTGYFGIGNEMSSVIDCWYIRVFDEDKGSGNVTISQNTLTNIGAKTESKTIHINPGDWDKQTNSYLIRYQPRYQNGVGIQLNLVSDFSIYEIVVSSRQGETQLTAPKAQI